MVWLEILLTALIAVLLELVMHWFPWRMILRRDLTRPAAYVLGVFGIAGPVSVLWALWGMINVVISLWAVIVATGLAVVGAYDIDALLNRLMRGSEAEELLNETRQPNDGAKTTP